MNRRTFGKIAFSVLGGHVLGQNLALAACGPQAELLAPEYSSILRGRSRCLRLADLRGPNHDVLVCSSSGAKLFPHQHVIEIEMKDILNPPPGGICVKTSSNGISPKVLSHWHEVKISARELAQIAQAYEGGTADAVVVRDAGLFGMDPVHEHDFVLYLPERAPLS